MDGKGRVSIPAAFRRVLEENDPEWTSGLNPNLIIVYGNTKRQFLEGFSVASISEVDDRIAALPRGSKSRRVLERMFSGQALHTNIDETGRLVLPQRIRDKVGMFQMLYLWLLAIHSKFGNPMLIQLMKPRLTSGTLVRTLTLTL